MNQALIGYTGFVGGNLNSQISFSYTYNSKNISDIQGESFDIVYCAGAPGVKWKANQNPAEDLASIQSLIKHLETIQTKKFILISTIDVYKKPIDVDEDTLINESELQPYGKHRFLLEEFVREHFRNHTVVRLPGLFGSGLKKNVIFDFMHHNQLDKIHSESVFQFYSLGRLSQDVQVVIENNIPLMNFSTEPVSVKEIAKAVFDMEFTNITEQVPARYDMRSKYIDIFRKGDNYMFKKDEILNQIKEFVVCNT